MIILLGFRNLQLKRNKLFLQGYIQHNAEVADGKAGFIEFAKEYASANPQMEILKVFANDNDEVAVFCRCTYLEGGQPKVDKVVDIFRFHGLEDNDENFDFSGIKGRGVYISQYSLI